MGSGVGEGITRAAELALEQRAPLLVIAASGGARMQEGCVSLMQMAKTSQAVARLNEEGVLFISLLTDPTYGGVSASFATLGDVLVSEPAPHRLRGPEGDRADDPPAAAGRLPDGGLPARARDARPGRAAREPCASRCASCSSCTRPPAQRAGEAAPHVRRRRRPDHRTPSSCRRATRGRSSSSPATSTGRTRSTTSSYIFDDFQELHGDRLFREDAAIVGGLGTARRDDGDGRRPPEGPHDAGDGRAELRHAQPGGLPQGAAADALRGEVRHADRHARRHAGRVSRPRRRGARPVDRDRREHHGDVALPRPDRRRS